MGGTIPEPGGGSMEGMPGGGNMPEGMGSGPLEGGSAIGALPSSCFIIGLISTGGARPGGASCAGMGRKAGCGRAGGNSKFVREGGSCILMRGA